MAYIPYDAKWYVAQILEEITVEDEPTNVVHTNFVLIRADSPEEAYERAVKLGKEREDRYRNPSGKQVDARFRGLRDLNVIHDELEHGAELLYEERMDVQAEQIEAEIRPKERLAVFRPLESRKSPDYSSKEIVDDAQKLLRGSS